MRFRLRTLLILMAVGPMVLAGGYWGYKAFRRATMTEFERTLEEYFQSIQRNLPK